MRTLATSFARLGLAGCLAGSIMAAALGEAAAQTDTRRSAPVNRFAGVEEIVFECTTSDSTAGFVDMPGMTRNFRLARSGAVVVMFHAAASLALGPALTTDTGYVQLQIDGDVQTPGDQIPFISTESTTALPAAYSFTWQSERLSSGQHTALIRWRTDQGSEFCVDARSLIILHR